MKPAPAPRIASLAASMSPGLTSMPRTASSTTVTPKPSSHGVEHRVLHAVVGRQPGDVHVVDAALAQHVRRGCRRGRPSSPACSGPAPCRRRRRPWSGRATGAARRPACPGRSATGQMPGGSMPSHFSGSTSTPANEPWSGGCQSRVATTRSKRSAIALIGPAISSPRSTGSAPPGVKSFWKSTISSASMPRIFAPRMTASNDYATRLGELLLDPAETVTMTRAGEHEGGGADPALRGGRQS